MTGDLVCSFCEHDIASAVHARECRGVSLSARTDDRIAWQPPNVAIHYRLDHAPAERPPHLPWVIRRRAADGEWSLVTRSGSTVAPARYATRIEAERAALRAAVSDRAAATRLGVAVTIWIDHEEQ